MKTTYREWWQGNSSISNNNSQEIDSYFFTDRPLYMPTQQVYYKAWIRQDDDLIYSLPSARQMKVSLKKYCGKDQPEIASQIVSTSTTNGSLDGSFELPADLLPGSYALCMSELSNTPKIDSIFDQAISTFFEVEYYRKPEYTLKMTPNITTATRGEKITIEVQGSYFSGQPLRDIEVRYNLDSYGFGGDIDFPEDAQIIKLNEQGKATFEVNTADIDNEGQDKNLSISLYYADASGDIAQDTINVLVFPGQYELKKANTGSPRTVKAGQPITVDLSSSSRVGGQLANLEIYGELDFSYWMPNNDYPQQSNSKYKLIEGSLPPQKSRTNSDGTASLTFTPTQTGDYSANIYIFDNKNNNYTKETFYYSVLSADSNFVSDDIQDDKKFNLRVGEEEVQIGNNTSVTLSSSIPDRDIFVTLGRGRVHRYYIFRVGPQEQNFDIPIEPNDIPRIRVSADSFNGQQLEQKSEEIKINTDHKKIDLEIKSNKEIYRPGEKVDLIIKASLEGRPVKTELALWSVDKALFELVDDGNDGPFSHYWEKPWIDMTTTQHSFSGISQSGAEGGGCFTSKTQISMADGTYKNIEDIKIGDQVLSAPDSQFIITDFEADSQVVTAIFEHFNHRQILVINKKLEITTEHLLFVNQKWTAAGDIQIGDTLLDAAGQVVEVNSIESKNISEPVYNFTVANNHTYFANNIWVHNQKGDVRTILKDTAYWNPSIWTNDQGKATVHFELPDNLTTWVMKGVAVNQKTDAGQGNSEFVVQKDITISPILPNILRKGDEINLGAVVRNQTDRTQNLKVGLSFDSGSLKAKEKVEISLPPYGLQELYWPVTVDKENPSGQVQLWVDGKNAQLSDNLIVSIPVLSFGISQKSSNTFNVESQSPFSIEIPDDTRSDLSKVSLSLSP